MKLTLRLKYAIFDVMREAEKRAPIGSMFFLHLSLVIVMSFRPLMKFVYRASNLVPIAATSMWNVVRKMG